MEDFPQRCERHGPPTGAGAQELQNGRGWINCGALGRPDRDRLTGRVEVGERYLGGLEEGVRGRQTEAKALIIIAAQEDGPGIS
jgi:hypothetical protein